MGIRLIVEILDHAPADLTPAERLVLIVLAEEARDHTRRCWPGIEVIARRAGMSQSGVRAVMLRLASRGLDPRITSAHRGAVTVYRLPDLAPKGDTTVSPIDDGKGDTTVSPIDGKVTPQSPKGDTPVSPSPSYPSKNKPSMPERSPNGESHNGLDLTLQDQYCEHGAPNRLTRGGRTACPLCRVSEKIRDAQADADAITPHRAQRRETKTP